MGNIATGFTDQERADALRRAAAWCRDGAPNGRANSVFTPREGVLDGALRCAIGQALLELENDFEAWMVYGEGHNYDASLVGANVPALHCISAVPGYFDHADLKDAARQLDAAADFLVPA